ncbi:MAG TPA: hypothetical protein VG125_10130 [Pirellulales bacterium]|jgi:hypothetical protein|nr:hypothetical protein [Pirellulales bacterium]
MKSEAIEIVCTVDVKPGEKLTLPPSLVNGIGPGRWLVSVRPAGRGELRQHDAFLASYAPQDEGLYDDLAR